MTGTTTISMAQVDVAISSRSARPTLPFGFKISKLLQPESSNARLAETKLIDPRRVFPFISIASFFGLQRTSFGRSPLISARMLGARRSAINPRFRNDLLRRNMCDTLPHTCAQAEVCNALLQSTEKLTHHKNPLKKALKRSATGLAVPRKMCSGIQVDAANTRERSSIRERKCCIRTTHRFISPACGLR
ncbi:hypothetical protein BN2475_640009 [Paraburkholderia ribeironis]|uniref:Uncharacterized protein n=1 Tax=Paraburkholderia ribeironis TaxID=1247936 RepID=A0A1N7SFS7_9BURK|nr:hypothetical protein BN2475_640009 [Paraburkholderia ribeironis]